MRFAIRLALALIAAPTLASASAAPSPPACTAAQSRQFDFWVGKWAVHPKSSPTRHVADSLIERRYGGCAIRENWMPLAGQDGGSLSTFVPATGQWRQFWVDASGAAVDFTGGWNGSAMVLTGVWPAPANPRQLTRMTYTPLAGGGVEQAGETSDDNGRTWKPSFDFIYERAR